MARIWAYAYLIGRWYWFLVNDLFVMIMYYIIFLFFCQRVIARVDLVFLLVYFYVK